MVSTALRSYNRSKSHNEINFLKNKNFILHKSSITSSLLNSFIIYDSSDEENRTGILGKALPKYQSFNHRTRHKSFVERKSSFFFFLIFIKYK